MINAYELNDYVECSPNDEFSETTLDPTYEPMICECGGHFIFENIVLTSLPPQYPYRCDHCGKRIVKRSDGTFYNW